MPYLCQKFPFSSLRTRKLKMLLSSGTLEQTNPKNELINLKTSEKKSPKSINYMAIIKIPSAGTVMT